MRLLGGRSIGLSFLASILISSAPAQAGLCKKVLIGHWYTCIDSGCLNLPGCWCELLDFCPCDCYGAPPAAYQGANNVFGAKRGEAGKIVAGGSKTPSIREDAEPQLLPGTASVGKADSSPVSREGLPLPALPPPRRQP
jgi:hypothetical protein